MILVPGIERCGPSAEPSFFRLKLHDGLADRHVFHNFDHRGNIVHGTRPIGVDADVSSREDRDHLIVRKSARKVDDVLHVLVSYHSTEIIELRAASDAGEMNIAAAEALEV